MREFESVRRLVRGYADAVDVAAALGCCYKTALSRMKHPEDMTLREIRMMCKRFRIPAEDICEEIRRDLA